MGWLHYEQGAGAVPAHSRRHGRAGVGGLYALVAARLVYASTGLRFPDQCPDGSWK